MLAAVVLFFTFVKGTNPPLRFADTRYQTWKSADIVFLNGTSWRSRLVHFFQNHSTDYSHVGIVIVENGVPFIIHADPAEGAVVKQRWDVVLAGREFTDGAIYRFRQHSPGISATVCDVAETLARNRAPFDEDFDLKTPQRLYCTELVWRAYLEAGVELRNSTGIEHSYIFPADLIDGEQLELLQRF